jgi:hypothetical protein
MTHPTFQDNDLVILPPSAVAHLSDRSLTPDRFYLVRVETREHGALDFEVLESGPYALVEALGLLALRNHPTLWISPEIAAILIDRRAT